MQSSSSVCLSSAMLACMCLILVSWCLQADAAKYSSVDALIGKSNDELTNIFKNEFIDNKLPGHERPGTWTWCKGKSLLQPGTPPYAVADEFLRRIFKKPLEETADDLWRGKLMKTDAKGETGVAFQSLLPRRNLKPCRFGFRCEGDEAFGDGKLYLKPYSIQGDGKPSIRLDYGESSARIVRVLGDELRRVSDDVWLGRLYVVKDPATALFGPKPHFLPEFPEIPGVVSKDAYHFVGHFALECNYEEAQQHLALVENYYQHMHKHTKSQG